MTEQDRARLVEALDALWVWATEQRTHLDSDPVPDGLGALVLAALASTPEPQVWRLVEDAMPESGQEVLVVVQTPRPCVMLAQWAAKLTLPAHPDAEGCYYDEERDAYFAEEGWYQSYSVNGSLDDEPFWRIHDRVSHWRPKPALPPPQEPS